VTDEPRIVIEAPAEVVVVADVEKKDVVIPPPPNTGGIRVTFEYPEAIYDAEGLQRLRKTAREAENTFTIEIARGAAIDSDFVETVRGIARDEHVTAVTVRVRRRG
jgi:hypothetical protein